MIPLSGTAERVHGDDTPVPVLAKGKTATARAWVYVRDDAPFGGPDPPAVLFRYSRDRSGDHPVEHLRTFTGILQADIYAGYNRLYAAGRSPGPVTEAACWSHCRRKFFELADIAASKGRGKNAPPISPLALEAVKRIDLLFDIERGINDSYVSRIMCLTLLAPDIVEASLDGRQPAGLTTARLMKPFSAAWEAQRARLLGG